MGDMLVCREWNVRYLLLATCAATHSVLPAASTMLQRLATPQIKSGRKRGSSPCTSAVPVAELIPLFRELWQRVESDVCVVTAPEVTQLFELAVRAQSSELVHDIAVFIAQPTKVQFLTRGTAALLQQHWEGLDRDAQRAFADVLQALAVPGAPTLMWLLSLQGCSHLD